MGGGGALKKGGVGVKICRIQGDLLVCGGLHFPGGFGFRRRKSPLNWHWIIPIYGPKCINFGAYAKYGHMVLGL